MRFLPLLALAGAMLTAATARAAEPSSYDPRAAFAESDTGRDGSIDRGEFYNRINEVFYRADANKDGYLVSEEIARLTFPDDMKTADSNHDARISVHEFIRVRDLDFESADRNKDGVLTVDEVVGAYEVKGQR